MQARRGEGCRLTDATPPSFEALYNRYRPQKFEDLIGQPHVVRTLQNALVHHRLSHAYLFSGERGTGKTTVARLLAKAVNCLEGIKAEPCGACDRCTAIAAGTFLDLIELDAASHTGIDDVRELSQSARFTPGQARYKVYIIDEIHQLSSAAKDALLKTLEEPPERTLFVLATTEPHRVPATIRSRCQHLTFRRIGMIELVEHLRGIVEREHGSLEDAALAVLARNAAGSVRDGISLLDQALAFADGDVTLAEVNRMLGLTSRDAVVTIARSLAAGDAAAGLHQIDLALQQGNSPGTLRRQLVDMLRELLLVTTSASLDDLGHLTHDEAHEAMTLGRQMDLRTIVQSLEVFAEPEPLTRGPIDPALELELAFARAVLAIRGEAPARAAPSNGAPATTQPAAAPSPPPTGPKPPQPPDREPAADVAERLAGGEDLTADHIRAQTAAWIDQVRRQRESLAPYVAEADVLGYADGVVTLGYRSDFLLERMERPDARETITQALSRAFEQPLRIKNVLQQGVQQPQRPPPGDTRDDDPVVRIAMRDHGAERLDSDPATGA